MLDSYSPPPVHTTSILLHPLEIDKLMGFQCASMCLCCEVVYTYSANMCVDLSGW